MNNRNWIVVQRAVRNWGFDPDWKGTALHARGCILHRNLDATAARSRVDRYKADPHLRQYNFWAMPKEDF